jgi:hypothetical protein
MIILLVPPGVPHAAGLDPESGLVVGVFCGGRDRIEHLRGCVDPKPGLA